MDLSGLNLSECTGCGSCADACPSARNGGFRPDEAVDTVLKGGSPEGIWTCLMCHRCSSACPSDVDVSGLMLVLRNASAARGEAPARFKQTLDTVSREGKVAVPKGRTVQMREDLGLPSADVDEGTKAEISALLEGDR